MEDAVAHSGGNSDASTGVEEESSSAGTAGSRGVEGAVGDDESSDLNANTVAEEVARVADCAGVSVGIVQAVGDKGGGSEAHVELGIEVESSGAANTEICRGNGITVGNRVGRGKADTTLEVEVGDTFGALRGVLSSVLKVDVAVGDAVGDGDRVADLSIENRVQVVQAFQTEGSAGGIASNDGASVDVANFDALIVDQGVAVGAGVAGGDTSVADALRNGVDGGAEVVGDIVVEVVLAVHANQLADEDIAVFGAVDLAGAGVSGESVVL